ncbi:unnamed protein product [Ambrosiozyma monospora]|uniref:Unnamed protein product n=1 Tax=Ambrosiozyma monospora TaxID=43982 RepID=A0ACB5T3Y1_AMBMO|nr:unnamed protein product [Ambrosiozyma monospora]
MSQALVNRSLTTIRTELEFLLDSNVITKSLFDQITQSLPDRYTQGMPAADLKSATKSASPAPAGPSQSANPEYAEALYDYHPQQPDDLELRVGAKIIIQEKMSPSWWRGTSNGRTGVFPANYVKIVGGSNEKAAYEQQQQPQQVYFQQSAPQPMQQYQAPPPSYVAPPVAVVQSQPEPVQVEQQQGGQHGAGKVGGAAKKFGSKLGNAAIFGAGASIGSNIVNSIF